MSQKFIKLKNNNSKNEAAFGKFYATAVYDNHFVGTDDIADFIQRQASVKKSDIKAVLQELGEAMKHFFEMGQKIKLEGIGILKVGFSSFGVSKAEDCTASTITTRRVLFQPETERVVVGQQKKDDGSVKQKYVTTHDNNMNVESESPSSTPSNGGNTSGSGSTSGGGNTSGSGNTSGGGNTGGGGGGDDDGVTYD